MSDFQHLCPVLCEQKNKNKKLMHLCSNRISGIGAQEKEHNNTVLEIHDFNENIPYISQFTPLCLNTFKTCNGFFIQVSTISSQGQFVQCNFYFY